MKWIICLILANLLVVSCGEVQAFNNYGYHSMTIEGNYCIGNANAITCDFN